jgi:hypothetical protein
MRFISKLLKKGYVCRGSPPKDFTNVFMVTVPDPVKDDPHFDAKVQALLDQTVDLVTMETKMNMPSVPRR